MNDKLTTNTISSASYEYFTADFMSQYMIITPEYLQKIRLITMAIFHLKIFNIDCDLNLYTINCSIKFKTLRFLFRRNKTLKKIKRLLEDNLLKYDINIKLIK